MISRPEAPVPPGSYVTVIADGEAPASRAQISATPPEVDAWPLSRTQPVAPLTESVTAPSDDAEPRPLPMPQYATTRVFAGGVMLALVIVAVLAVAYAVVATSTTTGPGSSSTARWWVTVVGAVTDIVTVVPTVLVVAFCEIVQTPSP